MKINEFFDKGYYINLDRRTDRRTYIETLLKELDLLNFCERFSAIDGEEYESYIMRHHCFSQTFVNLFKQALELNIENIVVFEDDFAIYENGLKNIENSLTQIKNNNIDWDLIYFGGYIRGETAQKVDTNLIKISGALTTHGIGISRKLMEYTLKKFVPFSDSSFDIWLSLQVENIGNIYCTYPFSTYQTDQFTSDLDIRFSTGNLDHWKFNFFTGKLV